MIKILIVGQAPFAHFADLDIEAKIIKVSEPSEAEDLLSNDVFDFVLGDFPKEDRAWADFIQINVVGPSRALYFHFSSKDYFLSLFSSEKELQHFMKVDQKQLLMVTLLPCDVYLMISIEKYVRLINAGENFAKEVLKRYEAKGINQFYVKRDEYFILSKEIQKSLLDSMKGVNSLQETTILDVANLQAENVLAVKEVCHNLRMDHVTFDHLNSVVDSNVRFVMKSKGSIKNFFKNFLNGGPYLYGHSIMISHVANYVALRMSWSTAKTMEKLSMAALLHDVALTDERLMKLDGLPEGAQHSFTENEVETFKKHPVLAYNIVTQQPEVLPDVAQIILAHHEKPDGTGFPRGLNATQLSQIACLFNISHFFVTRVYARPWSRQVIDDLIVEIKRDYNKGNYASVSDAFVFMLEEVKPKD